MSWEVLQQALGGQAAPIPLGLIKCCRGAGEHQAIAALMTAHALGRGHIRPHTSRRCHSAFFWSRCVSAASNLGEAPLSTAGYGHGRIILGNFVARCHLSSVQLGLGCALLTASGS